MNADNRSRRLQGLALASVGAVAFSGKAVIVKLSYRYGVDAVQVITYRMIFALPLFLALAWWSGRNKPPLTARDWRTLAGLGVTGYYLASYLDFMGLQYVSVSLERLIQYLSPTIVLVLGALLFGQAVTARQWTALALSYAGILVVFGHDVSISGNNTLLGSALVFGSAISYATYLLFSGQLVKRLGPFRITGVATSIACVLCIAHFFVVRPVSALAVPTEVLWLAALNATLCTFMPVVFVMLAVERIGAGPTAQTSAVGPLSTIFLGILLLDEPFTPWIAAGTALVLSGIALLARR